MYLFLCKLIFFNFILFFTNQHVFMTDVGWVSKGERVEKNISKMECAI